MINSNITSSNKNSPSKNSFLTQKILSISSETTNFINSKENLTKNEILPFLNQKFTEIFNLISSSNYEPILLKYEKDIRYYLKLIYQLNLQKETMENKIRYLLGKEEEYEKLKNYTKIQIENGELVDNNRKENEIIILRIENSNLKNEMDKLIKENDNYKIKEKNLLKEYENKNNILKKEIEDLKKKTLSTSSTLNPINSSLNINLNDISNSPENLKKIKKFKNNNNNFDIFSYTSSFNKINNLFNDIQKNHIIINNNNKIIAKNYKNKSNLKIEETFEENNNHNNKKLLIINHP